MKVSSLKPTCFMALLMHLQQRSVFLSRVFLWLLSHSCGFRTKQMPFWLVWTGGAPLVGRVKDKGNNSREHHTSEQQSKNMHGGEHRFQRERQDQIKHDRETEETLETKTKQEEKLETGERKMSTETEEKNKEEENKQWAKTEDCGGKEEGGGGGGRRGRRRSGLARGLTRMRWMRDLGRMISTPSPESLTDTILMTKDSPMR